MTRCSVTARRLSSGDCFRTPRRHAVDVTVDRRATSGHPARHRDATAPPSSPADEVRSHPTAIPVTSPGADAARSRRRRPPHARLEEALDEARVRRLVTDRELRRGDRAARRRGPGRRSSGRCSPARTAPATPARRPSGRCAPLIRSRRELPQPRGQRHAATGSRSTSCGPSQRLVVEVDGYAFHRAPRGVRARPQARPGRWWPPGTG